jgi:type VI secretion system protein ImpA
MSTAARTPNIEELLEPISAENPAGASLQYAGLYDELREARREEVNLEQGDWKRDLKVADWHLVVHVATDALAHRTKDLQVCAWLAEALVMLDGFDGCLDGLRLTRGLVERYWETVHPEAEDGNLDARVNSISWLDRRLGELVRYVPILRDQPGGDLAYFQWEEARRYVIPANLDGLDSDELRAIAELRRQAVEEGKTTSEEWRVASAKTAREALERQAETLAACTQELHALDRAVDALFGRDAPSLSSLRTSLEDVRSLVDNLVREKRALDPTFQSAEPEVVVLEGTTAPTAAVAIAAVGGGRPIRTREEALACLGAAAEFFQRNEPNSPIYLLVQRAVRWGNMPFESWLRDVVKNEGVLDELRETLGLRKSEEG